MTTPYSIALFAYSGLSGEIGPFYAPDGKTMIVQAVDGYSNPLLDAELYVQDAYTGGAFCYLVVPEPLPTVTSVLTWRGKQVFQGASGDFSAQGFKINASGTWDVRISGAILEGVNPERYVL